MEVGTGIPARRPTRTSNDRQLRAWLFRQENRAGVAEVMSYLSAREAQPNPWLWPRKPELSLLGCKNVVKRLVYDLSVYEELTGRDTAQSVSVLEGAMADLELFLMMAPPKQLHLALGASLVQAYVVLHGRAYRTMSWVPPLKLKRPKTAPHRGHDRTRFGEHHDPPTDNDNDDSDDDDLASENLFTLEELLCQDSSCTRDRIAFHCLSFHELLRARIRGVEFERHRETVVKSQTCGGFVSLEDIAYWLNWIFHYRRERRRRGEKLVEDDLPSPYSSPRPGTWKG